jgi:hypothetical protein
MEDVLSVYARAHDPRYPVVCVDEYLKELHATPRGTLPPEPGTPARQDYEWQRNGCANLFVSVAPKTGRMSVRVTDRRTAQDFAEELRRISDEDYPDALRIVLVTDNLNTHTPACLYERFAPKEAKRLAERFEWHYTPEHGSWLNVAECYISLLKRQCTGRRIADQQTLKREVTAWLKQHEDVPVKWNFNVADARIKLRHLYPTNEAQYLG